MNAAKTLDRAPQASAPRPHRGGLFAPAAAALLLSATALRLWAAWAARVPLDPDCAVVHRMTRAIAFDGARPLFFWGQAYLAPFEQALGAILLRLGCPLIFAPPLATALFSFAVFAVALRFFFLADGRRTALLGGLLLLAGPTDFALFQVAPRGGYIAILLLALLALLAGSRLACGIAAKAPASRLLPRAFLLGLLAGLGIWQSFLVLPYPAAAACGIALALLRARAPAKRWLGVLAAGLAGFLAGGAPFWAYNARHGFESFAFSQSALSLSCRVRGFLAWKHFVLLFAKDAPWAPWAAAAAAALAIAGTASLFRRRAARPPLARELLLESALAGAFWALAYLASGFVAAPTARYFLPAVPLLAFAAAALLSRIPFGRLFAVLLALAQIFSAASRFAQTADDGEKLLRHAAAFEETARAAGADAIYAPLPRFAIGLHLPENLPLVSARKAFDPALRRAAERARNPLYDAGEDAFGRFPARSGGEAERFGRLFGNARSAWATAEEIPPASFTGPPELSDGATTCLRAPEEGAPVACEWRFPDSPRIGFAVLSFAAANGRETVACERLRDGIWEPVVPRGGLPRWMWSGPRAYPETGNRALLALDGAPADGIRLSVAGDAWALQEVRFLGPARTMPPREELSGDDAVWRALGRESAGGLFFCGARWAANRVAEAGGDPRRIFGLDPAAWPEGRRTGDVPEGRPLAVAAEGADAAAVRRFWRDRGLERETPAGGNWTVFRGTAPAAAFWDGTRLLSREGTVDGSAPAPLE
ncbi:MAG: hypothetical protein IJS32_02465 [Kiritimatiellae bacterium]|nr:hypothetical protein [Kiritimatiellia bacterium]